jgi:hypothetical protein
MTLIYDSHEMPQWIVKINSLWVHDVLPSDGISRLAWFRETPLNRRTYVMAYFGQFIIFALEILASIRDYRKAVMKTLNWRYLLTFFTHWPSSLAQFSRFSLTSLIVNICWMTWRSCQWKRHFISSTDRHLLSEGSLSKSNHVWSTIHSDCSISPSLEYLIRRLLNGQMLAHILWWCTYCGVLPKSTTGCCNLARASGG